MGREDLGWTLDWLCLEEDMCALREEVPLIREEVTLEATLLLGNGGLLLLDLDFRSLVTDSSGSIRP